MGLNSRKLFSTKLTIQNYRRILSYNSACLNQFGYSDGDEVYILEKLNTPNDWLSKIIGDANRKRLEGHQKLNGGMGSIDELVKIHGFGPRSVKRVCDKLLASRDGLEEKPVRQKRLSFITSSLSESQAKKINLVGSVNIGANEVSWAVVNRHTKSIETWDVMSLDSYDLSSKKVDLLSLVEIGYKIVKELPKSDVYVLEDISYGMGGSTVAQRPSTRLLLNTVFASLLQSQEEKRVVLLSGRAVSQWSGRLVGGERVSSQGIVGQMVVSLSEGSGLPPSLVSATPTIRRNYLARPPPEREAVADALILALAFVYLSLQPSA